MAQWTRSDYQHKDDEGQAVAVDHRGNVIVVGTAITSGGDKDILVVSYSPTGAENWRSSYDNGLATAGDDIGMDVAVDWEGNAYVLGVADGGSGRDGDFVVIKYDKTGTAVWPSSGSTSLYDFRNGAIRLKDSSDDGEFNTTISRAAISMKDVPGEQPRFAITGPSSSKWRTVVYDAVRSTGVEVLSGWPVDQFGTVFVDRSLDVAIASDNTVYVTGGVHSSTTIEEFTTVKYKAGGNNFSPAYNWIDTWDAGPDGKPGHGVSIALDYGDNPYVTGALFGTSNTDRIGTRHLNTAGTVQWSDIYSPLAGGDPTSLSLSFEFNPSTGLQSVYTYITGEQNPGGVSMGTDAFTRRIDPTGSAVWTDVYGTSTYDDYGLHIFAMGKGNAYVSGSTLGTTAPGHRGGDMLLLPFRQAGTYRGGAFTYDNGDIDEGHWGAPVSAGRSYSSGTSKDTVNSDLFDFATINRVETPTSYAPDSFSLVLGVYSSGNLASFEDDDGDNYVAGFGILGSATPTIKVECISAIDEDATELSVHLTSHIAGSGTTGVIEQIEIYDYLSSSFKIISYQPAAVNTDATTVIPLKNDPAQYMDGSGNVKIRVAYIGAATGWSAYIDQVRFDIIGT